MLTACRSRQARPSALESAIPDPPLARYRISTASKHWRTAQAGELERQRNRAAHFGFPKNVWQELYDAGRVTYHPVFPGKAGWGARQIAGEDDVRDVIALLRLNYDRVAST